MSQPGSQMKVKPKTIKVGGLASSSQSSVAEIAVMALYDATGEALI